MPQLASSDKLNPIVLQQQPQDTARFLGSKRDYLAGLEHPFPRGPVRVPFKRVIENKQTQIVAPAIQSSASHSQRSKSQPKTKISLKQSLLNDYGEDIQDHLKLLESKVDQSEFLSKHQIQTDYRAKMVDWMVEVLTTFKNSDQTFFLAINIMDRYFKNIEKGLPSTELHLTGVVSMFISSKYEDIIPLLMKTVVNKIGHNKFEQSQIELKELEVLRVLQYRIGMPTVKEFLDRYIDELGDFITKVDRQVYKTLMCVCKMSCFSYDLMQIPTSLLAASILEMALRIGLIRPNKCHIEQLMAQIAEFSDLNMEDVSNKCKKVTTFIKNFDSQFSNLRNIKIVYGDELKKIKIQ